MIYPCIWSIYYIFQKGLAIMPHQLLLNPDHPYPKLMKLWFIIYLLFHLLYCLRFFLFQSLFYIPGIVFSVLSIYSLFLIMRKNKQGLYCLISTSIIFTIYSFIFADHKIASTYNGMNYVAILITILGIHKLRSSGKNKDKPSSSS